MTDTMTVAEAATMLGVHQETIRNHLRSGRLAGQRVGRGRAAAYQIERASVLAVQDEMTLTTSAQIARRMGVTEGRVRQLARARQVGRLIGKTMVYTPAEAAMLIERPSLTVANIAAQAGVSEDAVRQAASRLRIGAPTRAIRFTAREAGRLIGHFATAS